MGGFHPSPNHVDPGFERISECWLRISNVFSNIHGSWPSRELRIFPDLKKSGALSLSDGILIREGILYLSEILFVKNRAGYRNASLRSAEKYVKVYVTKERNRGVQKPWVLKFTFLLSSTREKTNGFFQFCELCDLEASYVMASKLHYGFLIDTTSWWFIFWVSSKRSTM